MKMSCVSRRFALLAALLLGGGVKALGQAGPSGGGAARLEDGGRAIAIAAPALAGFHGGFSATVVIGGVTQVLESASGALAGTNAFTEADTPYGAADVSLSTIRFEEARLDLLVRVESVHGAPVVTLRAGIRNFGERPVRLADVAPLAKIGRAHV